MITNLQERPSYDRRPNYEPASAMEQFIVPLLRVHIERVIGALATPAPMQGRVLDVGCGRQPFRGMLETAGYDYVGLDVVQNSLNNVDVICSIDESLPQKLLTQSGFEFILCTEVLEHVADWDRAFLNLAALLAPGGLLLITCPHFYRLHEEPHDFWRPTLHALGYWAERVGLQVCEQKAAGDAWDVLGTMLGSCWPAPRKRCLSHRIASRFVMFAKSRLFKVLEKGRLQKVVALQGKLYLSNIVVLKKPI